MGGRLRHGEGKDGGMGRVWHGEESLRHGEGNDGGIGRVCGM